MSQIGKLSDFNFKFKHAYGQNFIFDRNFLRSIVDTIDVKNKDVLEIGAGAGTLTAILSEQASNVVAFEIDTDLKPILESNLETKNNVKLVFDDIMKVSIENIEKYFENEYIIVANLPYYITTPIIFKFLENATKLSCMAIMVQLEVAERLVAKPGTKQYGAITPAIDYRANAKIIKRVNRNMFTPAPNVDSAIVKIDFVKDKYSIVSTKVLDDTIKCAFAMRRKTLANNMKNYFGFSQEVISNILSCIQISPSVRGETLSTPQLVALSNEICKYLK